MAVQKDFFGISSYFILATGGISRQISLQKTFPRIFFAPQRCDIYTDGEIDLINALWQSTIPIGIPPLKGH